MPHDAPLIFTIVAGIGLAFVFGALAARLRISPLLGYLLAGVVVGPHTPGIVADQAMAGQLAEIGVILLMFGVGLHFSWKDMLSVGSIAVPGALAQIAVATFLGWGMAEVMGWGMTSAFVFGLALSVASTVVLLRALQERHMLDSERGRIAVGWLVVEDIAMVLALVLLPALAGGASGPGGDLLADKLAAYLGFGLGGVILITLGKVAAFVALMMLVGRRVIPWLLHVIAHMGSRELFRLAVLAVALSVAFGASVLFGVSLALGAFFAGMVLSESALSQQAAQETLPLRDAFAVLFFVSVGMLFDPAELLRQPLPVLGVLFVVLFGKSAAAFAIVRLFRHPVSTALTISASLAQIGEFSFILAELGVRLGVLPEEGRNLILAGAILSILLNPLAFLLSDRLRRSLEPAAEPGTAAPEPSRPAIPLTGLSGHVAVIGGGAVGGHVAAELRRRGVPCLVVEESETLADRLRGEGAEVFLGNAADPEMLAALNLPEARRLVVAIPQAFEAGQVVEQARALSPGLDIVARAYSDPEAEYLKGRGADVVVTGTREVARALVEYLSYAGERPAEDAAAEADSFGAFI
jgi:CPA2 family monovalent cation:H+ antiporter-2